MSSSEALTEIIRHLEALDYEVVQTGETHRATHEEQMNFSLREFRGGFLLYLFFKTSDAARADVARLLGLANDLNGNATVARHYVDGDIDFVMDAWVPAAWDVASFSLLLDAWQRDTSRVFDHEAFKELIE